MIDDELMKLAVEAGATRYASPDHPDRPRHTFNLSALHRFAQMLRAGFFKELADMPVGELLKTPLMRPGGRVVYSKPCAFPIQNLQSTAQPIAVVQVPQDREQLLAVREGHFNAASAEYFNARPQLDTPENRRIFYAGHCKGYDAAPEAPAPAVVPPGYKLVPVEPTVEMAQSLIDYKGDDEMPWPRNVSPNFALAAYRIMLAAAPEAPAQAAETWRSMPAGPFKALHQARHALLRPAADGLARRCAIDAIDEVLAAPEAPAAAMVQVPQGERPAIYALKLLAQHAGPYVTEGTLLAHAYQQAVKVLAAAPEAPAQPSVPAPWREAVKVAREALEALTTEAVAVKNKLDGDLPYGSPVHPLSSQLTWPIATAIAAIAQLDALEGGE